MNIIFSLVLYKQNLEIIKPLFFDIDNFYNYGLKKNTKTLLRVYDNSPSINNDITKLIAKDYIYEKWEKVSDCKIIYFEENAFVSGFHDVVILKKL